MPGGVFRFWSVRWCHRTRFPRVFGRPTRHFAGIPVNLVYIWRVRLTDPIAVVACAAAMAGVSVAASAQTPGYHLLGFPVGTNGSYATGVSADGRWVSGIGVFSPGGNPTSGFAWSEATGRADFRVEAGAPPTMAYGISGDGGVVVGEAWFPGSPDWTAFRRTGTGTYENLGVLPGYQVAMATAASGDGSVVAGHNYFRFGSSNPSQRAFRWTQATGMQPLPYPFPAEQYQSQVNAVSRDGSTIVGYSLGFDQPPTVWGASGGVRTLPLLTGASSGEAIGTNHDGSVIVGRSGGFGVVWTGNAITQVMPNPTGWGAKATHISDDGSIILGTMVNFSTQIQTPAVWTGTGSWIFLTDYLADQGLPLPQGWAVSSIAPFEMSSNGRTFAGTMVVPGQGGDPATLQTVVITIPSVSTLGLCFVSGICFSSRRRRT